MMNTWIKKPYCISQYINFCLVYINPAILIIYDFYFIHRRVS